MRFTDLLPKPAAQLFGLSGAGERDPSRLIPYFDHIRPNVMLLKDGGVMGMLHLRSCLPFELSSNAQRNGGASRHFALLQLLADQQTEIVEHAVCHDNVTPPLDNGAGSAYWREFNARYQARSLGKLRQIDWYISVIVRPRPMSGAWFRAMWRAFNGGDPEFQPKLLRQLESKIRTIKDTLRKQNPIRLGTYEIGGIAFSEMAEALHLIRTTRKQRVPLTQPVGTLGFAMYRDRVTHGNLGFRIEWGGGLSRATFGRMFVLNVYPRAPRVDMFQGLLADEERLLGARWTMTNAIRPLNRAKAADKLELTLSRMEKGNDRASDDMEALEEALNALKSSKEVRGEHAWTFAVHADSMSELDDSASAYLDVIAGAGCSPAPAGIVGESTYWTQLPGNRGLSSQPATIGLRAFADLSSLEGYPGSDPAYRWDAPLMRFATAGGTAYDHGIFDGQIGHTLFLGPSQGGKSVAIGAFATAATALIGNRGTIIVCDKDESNKLAVLNNGGTYTKLQKNQDSGAAPLRRLRNTAEDRAILCKLIVGSIMSDGGPPVTERAFTRIRRGVDFVMRLPPSLRSLGAVHAWLPPDKLDPSDSANRLKPWCRGERLGWAIDGETDNLDFDARIAGVDWTQLLEENAALNIISAYIFELAGKVMDGRRMIFIVEELKFLLDKAQFAKSFEDILLTGRKKNIAFWPVIQQPEHLLSHPLGAALLGQCRTRILFKNEYANQDAYCGGGKWGDGLHATPQIYDYVRGKLDAGKWSFVMQRPGKSLVCRFDLSSMPEDLAVLSGTPASVALWDKITEARREFVARIEEAKA